MKKIPVRDFMTTDVTAARLDMPLTELVALLAEKSVRALPVTAEDGGLLGVVSETDLFLKEKGLPFSLEKVPTLLGQVIDKEEMDHFEPARTVRVEEVLTRKVVSVTGDTTLEDAAMLMFHNRLSLLPVEEDGKLIGVVRRINLLGKIYGGF